MRSLPVRALLALVATATALVAAPAPSYAAPTLTTSSGEVVLYDECQSHPISFALNGATAFQIRLSVTDPDGFTSQGWTINSAEGDQPSGTVSMTFCGSEKPGTWTVKAALCSFTCQLDTLAAYPSSTFTVRKAQTETALRAKKLKRGGYKLIARVDREEPGGFAASQGVLVRFERLVGDEWRPVVRRLTSTVDGVAKLSRGLPRGTRVRALVPEANNYSASVSQSVRLRR